jgi:hypothetical protein
MRMQDFGCMFVWKGPEVVKGKWYGRFGGPPTPLLGQWMVDISIITTQCEHHDIPDLTSALATEYREFSQRESKTFAEWDAKRIRLENEGQELAPLEKEAHLDVLLRSYYQDETKVYGKLIELQGLGIPKFFGQTRFVVDPSLHSSLEAAAVPGILLEYIERKKLEELPPQLFNESIARLLHWKLSLPYPIKR